MSSNSPLASQKEIELLLTEMLEIDKQQHQLFQDLNEELNTFDPEGSKDEHMAIFKKALIIKKALIEIQYKHIEVSHKLAQNGKLYFADNCTMFLPEKYVLPSLKGKNPQEIIESSYFSLLSKIRDSSQLEEEDFKLVNSYLMELASRPQGQKLLVKFNYLLEKKNAPCSISAIDEFTVSRSGGATVTAKPDYKYNNFSSFKEIIKESSTKGKGVERINITVPKKYYESDAYFNVELAASNDQRSRGLVDIGPGFLLFGHELIHACHFLSGSAKLDINHFFAKIKNDKNEAMATLYEFRDSNKKGEPILKNNKESAEEFWTIEGAKLSENKLRNEHGLLNRIGHGSVQPDDSYVGIKELIALGESQKANDDSIYKSYWNEIQNMTEEELESTQKDQEEITSSYQSIKNRFS